MEQSLLSVEAVNTSLGEPITTSNCLGNWTNIQPLVQACYHYWPQTYYHYEPNKFEQAFKILQKLIDKKMVEVKTVKQFIETLGDIQSVL